MVPNRLHPKMVHMMEGRKEEDTFPTECRTNTRRDVQCLAAGSELKIVSFEYLSQYPNYLMFNGMLLFMSMLYGKLISKVRALLFLRGWILVTLEKSEAFD